MQTSCLGFKLLLATCLITRDLTETLVALLRLQVLWHENPHLCQSPQTDWSASYEELKILPWFKAENNISDADLVDVITNGLPHHWLKEMDCQHFDPLARSTKDEDIDFCKWMKPSNEMDKDTNTAKSNNGNNLFNKSTSKAKELKTREPASIGMLSRKGEAAKPGDKMCTVHGACGHTTNECHTIQGSPQEWVQQHTQEDFSNKTWKCTSGAATIWA